MARGSAGRAHVNGGSQEKGAGATAPQSPERLRRAAALAQRLRLGALSALALSALALLAFRLHDVQVRDRARYSSAQDRTSLRRVRVPATRGRILDREGRVLAESSPRFCAVLYLDELRAPGRWSNTVARVDAQLDALSAILGRRREIDRDAIWTHLKRRRPIPLVALHGLSEAEMALLSERDEPLAGLGIEAEQDRLYPYGDLACHVIGYVGRGTPDGATPDPVRGPDETAQRAFDYMLPDLTGRGGVEKAFDEALAGRGGARLLRIDAVGYARESVAVAAPVAGRDVVLALDAAVQKLAERALATNCGAAVVLDARNGDILALASAPRYDLRSFVPTLSPRVWNALLNDKSRPLLHRALSGLYPPGSTVKPAVVLSALANGLVSRDHMYECDGRISVGARRIRCSSRWGHGTIGISRAIASSCNPFFIDIGLKLGWDGAGAMRDMYDRLGFGRSPVPETGSGAGFLPSGDWKRRRHGDRWRDGDTANASIGQGYVVATPLQAARMALALANDGEVLKLRLVRDPGSGLAETGRVVEARMPWRAEDMRLVREGMVQTVEGAHGTARRAAIPWLRWAAKTGTAEYGPGNSKNYGWTIAYAPAYDPRCAIAVVLEDSDHGGISAAATVREILTGLFPPPPGFEEIPPRPEVPQYPDAAGARDEYDAVSSEPEESAGLELEELEEPEESDSSREISEVL